jgi:hypothetical protein
LRWRESSQATSSGGVAASTLERLYVLALKLDPEAAFCFTPSATGCDSSELGNSHAEVLRQIALLRETVLTKMAARETPWRMVSFAARGESADGERVSVRVTADGKPVRGTNIFFSQAPHSFCAAKTDNDGVAGCQLVDQHGDEDEHHDSRGVVATFPGEVGSERVLPPTTFILEAASHEFQRNVPRGGAFVACFRDNMGPIPRGKRLRI